MRALLIALAALLVLAAPAAARDREPLLGTAVDVDALGSDDRYRALLAREFDSVTAENVMKWYAVEPQRGVDDFDDADRLVRFARRHRQSVYGHTLIWHNQLPSWLTEGEFGKAELKRILRRHIFAVAGHFRGKVRAWDVVNEAIGDDGQWRDTIFYRAFGEEYVAMALRWARQADPHAKLFLNDYNIEGVNAKSDAYYELARDLRRRGVPLDGIGIQGHLSLMYDFPGRVEENLRRFARLGLEPAFTEVDVRIPLPVSDEELAEQADWFGRLYEACRAVRPCETYTVWGFTDRYSWVPSVFPGEGAATPFDEEYRPKPAWAAIHPERVAVDTRRTHQRVDGFGFSEAFQRSKRLHGSRGLSEANQQRILDLLFTPAGADFSILRNGIGSSPSDADDWMPSIAPVDPGGPDDPLDYRWDGDDQSQVWLSKEAMRRGVRQIYADAWSAPGYMKTPPQDPNEPDAYGGTLCGLPGAQCASGEDWRRRYAEYLVKYLELYRGEGIPIDYVGFVNEPELATEYASMVVTPAQAADFMKVLGPVLARSGLRTKIACCDAVGWDEAREYVETILADPKAARWLGLATGHGYSNPPDAPLTHRRPAWQSEWAQFLPWNTAWDDGSDASGFTWAQRIQTAFTKADVRAFLHWWGASDSTANSGLIRFQGDSFETSKRFWAFAAFSRFVRPGAVRLTARATGSDLGVSAFRNPDRSISVQVLNSRASAAPLRLELGRRASGTVRAYTVDAAHDLTPGEAAPLRGGALEARVPARALVTYVIRPR